MEPVVILTSGGINSAVACMRVIDHAKPHLLHIDFGQRAAESERHAATKLSESLAIDLHTATIQCPQQENTDGEDTPKADRSDRRRPGVVMAMFGLAEQLAMRLGAAEIVSGASQLCNEADLGAASGGGDPETQHVYLHAIAIALEKSISAKRHLSLDIPFIEVGREDIIRVGLRMGTPFHLTWSCHQSRRTPCETCPGCRSRIEAFASVGMDDPLVAAAR
jgi:7-cyano-7-deazaguanine synthase